MHKVIYPTDKRKWHPSLIPGTIVLISTYDIDGIPNIAPKSWIQMVSFNPSIIMFSGVRENTTENNIINTKCFVVNFVHSSILQKVYNCIKWHGIERIDKLNFSLTTSETINAPIIDQCRAHLECKYVDSVSMGSGYVIFGEIINALIWEKILFVEFRERYNLLDTTFYLEEGITGLKMQTIVS